MPSIQLAVPTRGLVDHNTVRALQDIRDAYTLSPVWWMTGRLSAADVRNRIVRRFLTQCAADYLWMVDDDVVPHPEFPRALRSEPDVVGAPYPILRPSHGKPNFPVPVPCAFEKVDGGFRTIPNIFGRTGMVLVDGVATGCMAIHRKVLQSLPMPFRFGVDPHGQLLVSEDMEFCTQAREAGAQIWADFDHPADHIVHGVSLGNLHNGYSRVFLQVANTGKDGVETVTVG